MNKRISFLIILILLLNMSFVVFAEDTATTPAIENGTSDQIPTEEAIVTPDGVEDSTNTGPAVSDSQNSVNDPNQVKAAAVGDLPAGVTITGGIEGIDWSVNRNRTDCEIFITGTGLTLSGSHSGYGLFNINYAKDRSLDFTISNFSASEAVVGIKYEKDAKVTFEGKNELLHLDLTPTHYKENNLAIEGKNNASLTCSYQIYTNTSANHSHTNVKNMKLISPEVKLHCKSIEIINCKIYSNKSLELIAYSGSNLSTNTFNNIKISNSYIESPKSTYILAYGNTDIEGVSGTLASIPDPVIRSNSYEVNSIPDGTDLRAGAIIGTYNTLNLQVNKNEKLIINQQNQDYDYANFYSIFAGNGITIPNSNSLADTQGNPAFINTIQLRTATDSVPAYSVTDKNGNLINSFTILGETTPKNDSSDNGKNNSVDKNNNVNDETNSPTTNDDSSPYLWIFMIMLSVVAISSVRKLNVE